MREKKSETLEVRLPHRLKAAFMARCRAEGRSASEAVREMIKTHLARPASRSSLELAMFLRPKIAVPAALAAAAVTGALFAASTSQAGPDLREAFKALDKDANGAVTAAEFTAAHRGDIVRIHKGQPPHADAPKVILPLSRTPELERLAKAHASPEAAREAYASLDEDRSGAVDLPEFERHHRRVHEAAFAGLDADKDGKVSGDEFWGRALAVSKEPALKESLRQTFTRLDADRDGAISRAEFAEH